MGQILDNAIAWVQFRNAGGLKSSVLLAVAYAAGMIGLCALIVMVNAGQTSSLNEMPRVFLAIQGVIVGVINLFRILNAVQRDTAAKLMESHRLMPVDPRLAVLGYAAGGGLSVVPIAVVNLLLGAIATGRAGLPLEWWFWANGVLLGWSIFTWCMAAGGGMLGTGIGILCLAPILVTMVTGGGIALMVPGLMPMASPLVGRTIFRIEQVDSELLVRSLTCMVLQLPVAWTLILVGARRFRSGDVPGLTGPLGCALVLALALSSIVTMRYPGILPRHLGHSTPEAKHIGTLVALMVLGSLTVVSHVARHAMEFHGRYRGRALWLRDAAGVLVILLAPVAYLVAVPDLPYDWVMRACWTFGQVAIVIVAMLLWAKWLVRRGVSLGMTLVVAGAWWILPLAAGGIVNSRDPWQDSSASVLLQVSPMGMLSAIWNDSGNLAQLPSLLVQLAVPAAAVILLLTKGSPAGESQPLATARS